MLTARLLQQLQDLADACGKIDPTRKKEASVEEVKGALKELLTFLTGASTASLQRLAVVSGQAYVCATQVLEAETAVKKCMYLVMHNYSPYLEFSVCAWP